MAGLYYVFETALGWAGIAGADGKIARLELPSPTKAQAKAALTEGGAGTLVESARDFSGEADRIKAYFSGKRMVFCCNIAPSHASCFEMDVWQAAREIGYGTVQTYGWIADRIGRPAAFRAVGQALGRNPVPVIVPCHRVIRSDGSLGGFGAGLAWKCKLLNLEGYDRRELAPLGDYR